ncbi:hypothetical protein B0T16DRAFT_404618 [Cercophora newfieldiana]|uniref:Uncharacterized protein n=1 Tax=Cercophora newfieldiana TaxID=92897 RepID=A0AA40CV73_9PEZI|nr:hypothetical protein B0T16DRAFT_404618 [Cercophora newfieldiana]
MGGATLFCVRCAWLSLSVLIRLRRTIGGCGRLRSSLSSRRRDIWSGVWCVVAFEIYIAVTSLLLEVGGHLKLSAVCLEDMIAQSQDPPFYFRGARQRLGQIDLFTMGLCMLVTEHFEASMQRLWSFSQTEEPSPYLTPLGWSMTLTSSS